MTEINAGRARRRSLALGVLLIIVGAIAMTAPLFATLAMIKLLGWLLIVAAIQQGVYAYQSRREGNPFFKVLLAVLYAIVAVMLLRRPVSGAVAATAIIAALFLLDGIMEIGLGIQMRRESRRSGWLFAGGILSLLFGAAILYWFPTSAVWTIGLLVGIRLIFKGIEQIMSTSPGAPDVHRPSDLKRAA
jgi:uncharacterized membrane protein HdeD (DUF308 family)